MIWKPRHIGWITAAAVGLLVFGVACAVAPRGVCYGAVCVEWNGQPDRNPDKLAALVARAERTVGYTVTPHAEIVFIPRLPAWARPHSRNGTPASAWYDVDSGLLFVTYIDDLWRSEIGHELLHRELALATGDADPNHTDPRWQNFCGGGYYVCR